MATLAVVRFGTADGAHRAAAALEDLDPEHARGVHDAALVEWVAGARKPRTRHLPRAATTALDDGFWGLLFGLVFFVPLLGAAIGATTGALVGALADVGIDDLFINRVRDQVAPGSSALFLLCSDGVVDPLVAEVRAVLPAGVPTTVISTYLEPDQDAALHAVFAD